jgi:hypothetical protein
MTAKLPEVGKLVLPGQRQATLTEIVTQISVEYATDQVAELTLTLADIDDKVTKTATSLIGSTVTFDGTRWQIGTVEASLAAWGSELVIRARDPLAKKLRVTYKTSAEKKVSPGDWVTGRVKAAGGTALVEPSSKRATIAQSKNQSVLDVVGDLAGELEWSWTSYDGRMIFGSRYSAWQGRVGSLPTWRVTWKADPDTDALVGAWSLSDDNTENRAELDLELPYGYGKKIRPWHRLSSSLPGASGLWLVETVSITHDGVTPVQITATQPKKPSPKAGSSAKE